MSQQQKNILPTDMACYPKANKKHIYESILRPVLTERSQPPMICHVASEEETQYWLGLHVIP